MYMLNQLQNVKFLGKIKVYIDYQVFSLIHKFTLLVTDLPYKVKGDSTRLIDLR